MIELLVTIAIIGLLALVILIAVEDARANGRDAFRKTAMKQVETALELYKHKNGSYPSTGGAWWGENFGANRAVSGANAYIPNLTPTYLFELPKDPNNPDDSFHGFNYRSDGSHYKLVLFGSMESTVSPGQALYDSYWLNLAWMICDEEPACSWNN